MRLHIGYCIFVSLYSMPVSVRKYFVTLYRRQLVHAHYHQHIDRAEVSQYGLYSGKWNITVIAVFDVAVQGSGDCTFTHNISVISALLWISCAEWYTRHMILPWELLKASYRNHQTGQSFQRKSSPVFYLEDLYVIDQRTLLCVCLLSFELFLSSAVLHML